MHESFENYALGIESMDTTHREYLMLFDDLMGSDDSHFIEVLEVFVDHVRRHFTNENQLMLESGFPHKAIHRGEHESVLERMEILLDMAKSDRMEDVRSWMEKNMPDWFLLHLRTMDSELAHHLKASSLPNIT